MIIKAPGDSGPTSFSGFVLYPSLVSQTFFVNMNLFLIQFIVCCKALCFCDCVFSGAEVWRVACLSPNRNGPVVVRRVQFDVFVTESCVVAVMLTDCDWDERTVCSLTQHFLCGNSPPQKELTSLCTAFYSVSHPPSTPFHHSFLTTQGIWMDGNVCLNPRPHPNRAPQLYANQAQPGKW